MKSTEKPFVVGTYASNENKVFGSNEPLALYTTKPGIDEISRNLARKVWDKYIDVLHKAYAKYELLGGNKDYTPAVQLIVTPNGLYGDFAVFIGNHKDFYEEIQESSTAPIQISKKSDLELFIMDVTTFSDNYGKDKSIARPKLSLPSTIYFRPHVMEFESIDTKRFDSYDEYVKGIDNVFSLQQEAEKKMWNEHDRSYTISVLNRDAFIDELIELKKSINYNVPVIEGKPVPVTADVFGKDLVFFPVEFPPVIKTEPKSLRLPVVSVNYSEAVVRLATHGKMNKFDISDVEMLKLIDAQKALINHRMFMELTLHNGQKIPLTLKAMVPESKYIVLQYSYMNVKQELDIKIFDDLQGREFNMIEYLNGVWSFVADPIYSIMTHKD